MRIGCPKEIKPQELRVGLTPGGVEVLCQAGHQVYMERNAGVGSGFTDEEYIACGAQVLASAKEVYEIADMIVKVKEPVASEYGYFREGMILYTYLHLADNEPLTRALMRKKLSLWHMKPLLGLAVVCPAWHP